MVPMKISITLIILSLFTFATAKTTQAASLAKATSNQETSVTNQETAATDQENAATNQENATISQLLTIEAICNEQKLQWNSIEILDSLNTKREYFIRADEKLHRFTPLILYARTGIELRKVPQGRELYFSKKSYSNHQTPAPATQAILIFSEVRKKLNNSFTDATEISTKIVQTCSKPKNVNDTKTQSALRITTNKPYVMLDYLNRLRQKDPNSIHIYRLEFSRNLKQDRSQNSEKEFTLVADIEATMLSSTASVVLQTTENKQIEEN